jgi:hypothetical protein
MRLLGYMLLVVGLGAGITYFVLVDRYVRILPRSPRPESGAVIPMDVHGTRVFLTNPEERILWGLQLGGVVVGSLGGLLLKCGGRKKMSGGTGG